MYEFDSKATEAVPEVKRSKEIRTTGASTTTTHEQKLYRRIVWLSEVTSEHLVQYLSLIHI